MSLALIREGQKGSQHSHLMTNSNDQCHSERAKRSRNLKPRPVTPPEAGLQLRLSRWRQDQMLGDFGPHAEFILSNAKGLGVTF